MLHGIINVYKEKGFTSHDVVAKLRGILHQKKIGHTGTLDPDAEGVLPVCLGAGTKLCDLLADHDKEYRAVLLLGQTTDTQDVTGQVLSVTEEIPQEEAVKAAIESFVGEYDQIPPMYSALKVNGKRLYELAREGKTVERKARRVQIYSIEIEKIDLPRVTFRVACSKGTYIRTLCNDIGEKLGCGGCMEELLRTKVDRFVLEDSLKLSEIEALAANGGFEKAVFPVDAAFAEYPAVRTLPVFDRLLYNGNPLEAAMVKFTEALEPKGIVKAAEVNIENTDGKLKQAENTNAYTKSERTENESEKLRVYDSKGSFCGLYALRPGTTQYRPEKMFLTSN